MRFKRVYIEISNICNLHCEFCSPLKREKRIMTISEFSHIIKEIKPFANFIYFHVKGEPLMHKDLSVFLDICAENGIMVNITTNATLLKQNAQLLLNSKALRQMNLSLHSFGGNDINGTDNGGYEDYIEEALEFAKNAANKGIFCVMRLWNLTENNEASERTLSVIKKIGEKFSYQQNLCESIKTVKSVKLAPFAFVGFEKEFVWPSVNNPFVSDDGFCYGMRHQIAILCDGTVVPCCLDANGEAPLGNIYRENFCDIIETKAAKEILHGFLNGQAINPLCKHCTFRTRFD